MKQRDPFVELFGKLDPANPLPDPAHDMARSGFLAQVGAQTEAAGKQERKVLFWRWSQAAAITLVLGVTGAVGATYLGYTLLTDDVSSSETVHSPPSRQPQSHRASRAPLQASTTQNSATQEGPTESAELEPVVHPEPRHIQNGPSMAANVETPTCSDSGSTLTVTELAALAHQCYRAGLTPEAIRLNRTLRQRFANTPEAANAAFALGRLLSRRDPDEARRAFLDYLAENPGGDFAREALGRTIELAPQGQGAEQARLYLSRYPQGPHRTLASELLRQAESTH